MVLFSVAKVLHLLFVNLMQRTKFLFLCGFHFSFMDNLLVSPDLFTNVYDVALLPGVAFREEADISFYFVVYESR